MFAKAYMGRRRRGAAPSKAFATHAVKAFEKLRFRPMYALANMGHPSREGGFVRPSIPVAGNPEKILRTDLSPLQYQLQSVETSCFLGMRAAQRSPRGKRAGKSEGSEAKLLNSMGRSVSAAQNNAANAGLLYQPKQ